MFDFSPYAVSAKSIIEEHGSHFSYSTFAGRKFVQKFGPGPTLEEEQEAIVLSLKSSSEEVEEKRQKFRMTYKGLYDQAMKALQYSRFWDKESQLDAESADQFLWFIIKRSKFVYKPEKITLMNTLFGWFYAERHRWRLKTTSFGKVPQRLSNRFAYEIVKGFRKEEHQFEVLEKDLKDRIKNIKNLPVINIDPEEKYVVIKPGALVYTPVTGMASSKIQGVAVGVVIEMKVDHWHTPKCVLKIKMRSGEEFDYRLLMRPLSEINEKNCFAYLFPSLELAKIGIENLASGYTVELDQDTGKSVIGLTAGKRPTTATCNF